MTIKPFDISFNATEHPLVCERWEALVKHFGGPNEALIAILSGHVEIGDERGYAVEFRPGAKIERMKL
jgi:hypothetical protein